MSEKTLILRQELEEAERALADAIKAGNAAERHLRIMTGWQAEILRLLEEEDKHG